MTGSEAARQVEDPEDLVRLGVVDRRGRARPAVKPAVEVLGGEDLDRVVELERGADRVGPDRALAAQMAREEARGDGDLQRLRMPAGPQQDALGVAEHREVTRVLGGLGEHALDQRQQMRHRVLGQGLGGLGSVEHLRGRPVRVDARAERPASRSCATTSRRIDGGLPLLRASSCARRRSRAHLTGSTCGSIPTQGLRACSPAPASE